MTIAACYVSPEGVVLGADSTTTYGNQHYNSSQKVFEIGDESTLGVVTWGLGGLHVSSHRTLFATLGDDLRSNPPTSVLDVAERWASLFWDAYSDQSSPVARFIDQCKALHLKLPYTDGVLSPQMRTPEEEQSYAELKLQLVAGFCLGGYVPGDRSPAAFEVIFDPLQDKPEPVQKPHGWAFWGAPNMVARLLFGCDDELKAAVLRSGKWSGSPEELDLVLQSLVLQCPILPIRDAIDFVHTCIATTIKAFKFSSLAPICGGPIEIAVMTTDRKFRWVKHKRWDAAITEGDT